MIFPALVERLTLASPSEFAIGVVPMNFSLFFKRGGHAPSLGRTGRRLKKERVIALCFARNAARQGKCASLTLATDACRVASDGADENPKKNLRSGRFPINNQIAGDVPMKWTTGAVVALPFAVMAAIPIAIGAVIFAPIYVPIALVCSKIERSESK